MIMGRFWRRTGRMWWKRPEWTGVELLLLDEVTLGWICMKTMKKSSRQVKRYYSHMTLHFHTKRKKVIKDVALIRSKRLRNQIVRFLTYLMKRIQKNSLTNISLKLQEEEWEQCMNFVLDVSTTTTDHIEVHRDMPNMLVAL
ncbi:hypothetical protein Fmac_006794 [Flemingia macrophylla]|uniref:Uncharacterized protein n=1 Tax=Flemingia macrophylla TaxID=520843 RepID=A0ABD1NBN0_9FABA